MGHERKQVISNLAAVQGRVLKPSFDSKEEPMKSIYLSIVSTPAAAWRLAKTTAFVAVLVAIAPAAVQSEPLEKKGTTPLCDALHF
jgi:hypothetical protein